MTAVEWLVNNLLINGIIRLTKDDHTFYKKLYREAKQIEKEQIIKSNRDGVDMCVDKKPFITGEQYYNQNYDPKK